MRNCHNSTAAFDLIETEILEALKAWFAGYMVKLQTIGYADDVVIHKKHIQKINAEIKKLRSQLSNAHDLVEQGVYTTDEFITRRKVIQEAISAAEEKKTSAEAGLRRILLAQEIQEIQIPQTEQILGAYEFMTNSERNALLKQLVRRIEYRKASRGNIEIDIYPTLPKIV